MQQDLNRVIEQVSKEKGIDKTILISALENAMISAAKKKFGHQRKIEAQFNPEIGEVELFEAKTVVEAVQDNATEITLEEARDTLDPDAQMGDELLCKLDSSLFGRIAAQAAKQNIVQRLRDAEREIIYNEFKGREGQLVNGIVQRFEKRNIIVNLGRTDAILPGKGAGAAGALSPGRPHSRLYRQRRDHQPRAADRSVAHPSEHVDSTLRPGGSGNL